MHEPFFRSIGCLVCGTYKVLKIRAKVVLNINWLVKTPRLDYITPGYGLLSDANNWELQSSYSQDDSEDYAQSAYSETDGSVERSSKVLFLAQPSYKFTV